MAKLNGLQRDLVNQERRMTVSKRNDMVQCARYRLSVQEQRAILYAISKIKPDDCAATEYSFSLRDFFNVCGLNKDTYTSTKKLLKELGDKSWWVKYDDGSESLVRWFNTLDCDFNSDKVTFKFHERMVPYLLNLVEQGEFYTSFELRYVLPMTSKHSPRLYELLKSYSINNSSWFFDLDELRRLLDCDNYKRWPDFKRRVLDPAVDEINKYTDIVVTYDAKKLTGRGIDRVVFQFDEKTSAEKYDSCCAIEISLDGQLGFIDTVEEVRSSNASSFVKSRLAAHRK